MTTTLPTPGPLLRDDACPAWCDGHDGDRWLPWMEDGDGSPVRSHAHDLPDVFTADGIVGVIVSAEEDRDGVHGPGVRIFAGMGDVELTIPEARQLAERLMIALMIAEGSK